MPIVSGFVVPKMNPTSHVGNIRLLRQAEDIRRRTCSECTRLARPTAAETLQRSQDNRTADGADAAKQRLNTLENQETNI